MAVMRASSPAEDNMASPAFTPGPYSPVHEAGVIDFLCWYQDLTTRRLRPSPPHHASAAAQERGVVPTAAAAQAGV